jgi:hypothetical protein
MSDRETKADDKCQALRCGKSRRRVSARRRGASACAKAAQLCAPRMPSARPMRAIVGSVIVGRVDNRSMAQVPGALLAPADGASGR